MPLNDMQFVGECERHTITIDSGQNSKDVIFSEAYINNPRIIIVEASGNVTVGTITLTQVTINATDTDGRTVTFIVCHKA